MKNECSETEIDILIESLQNGYLDKLKSESDREMLRYSIKLTNDPASICDSDIADLRGCGFDDRAIHDLACCVSYFAFVNRIADGLGVRLETDSGI